MRVVLIGDMSGTRNGQEWPPRGSIIDLPDAEAATLCGQRMARPLAEGEGVIRTAAAPVIEVEAREAVAPAAAPAVRRRGSSAPAPAGLVVEK